MIYPIYPETAIKRLRPPLGVFTVRHVTPDPRTIILIQNLILHKIRFYNRRADYSPIYTLCLGINLILPSMWGIPCALYFLCIQ